MPKPTISKHSTLVEMKAFVRKHKLNHPSVKLGMKKAEMLSALDKLGHINTEPRQKPAPKKKAAPKPKKRVTFKSTPNVKDIEKQNKGHKSSRWRGKIRPTSARNIVVANREYQEKRRQGDRAKELGRHTMQTIYNTLRETGINFTEHETHLFNTEFLPRNFHKMTTMEGTMEHLSRYIKNYQHNETNRF